MQVFPQCLVVAPDESRLQMLSSAAVDGGWRTIPHSDPDSAITECERLLIQLAIVDLQDSAASERLWALLEYLAGVTGLLVVVCGQGDSRQEIRCRQLGAWVFLPGVSNGDDLAQVLTEANRIVISRAFKPEGWLAAT